MAARLSSRVIPVSRHAKTGTHTREHARRDLCLWVPDKRSALSGMTPVFQSPR
jgi:hypothetical protein